MDRTGTVSWRADTARLCISHRPAGAFGSGHSGGDLHRVVRRDHAGARLGAVLAGFPGFGDLGGGLLWRFAGRPTLSYRGYAGDGSGDAHLARRAELLRAGRHARRAVLDLGIDADAACSAGWLVQRAPAAVARHHPGDRYHQQLSPFPVSAIGDQDLLNEPAANGLTVRRSGAML